MYRTVGYESEIDRKSNRPAEFRDYQIRYYLNYLPDQMNVIIGPKWTKKRGFFIIVFVLITLLGDRIGQNVR